MTRVDVERPQSLFERVRDTMAATFNVSPAQIHETTTQQDVARWDSLAHINLMVALESAFDVVLEVDDIGRLTSVPAIMAHLSK